MERLHHIVADSICKRNVSIKIVYSPPTQEIDILADETRLMQVLMNLTSNALNYTSQGSISIRVEESDDYISFSVSDTGCGIAKEFQQKVFDRFYRTGALRDSKHGGTGLGLTICQSLVEMMGGSIWLSSELNVGTKVGFTIPNIKAAYKQVHVKIMTTTTPVFSDFSAMVVEDDKNSQEYLKELLKPLQFKDLVFIDNGIDAIELATKGSFDVILMDIQIPGINGIESAQHIKKIKPEIAIIAQTAFAMQNDRETCIASGFDEYITKPIKPQELTDALVKVLKI